MKTTYSFQYQLGRQAFETACTNSLGKKVNRVNEYQINKMVLVGGNSLRLSGPVDSTPLRGMFNGH